MVEVDTRQKEIRYSSRTRAEHRPVPARCRSCGAPLAKLLTELPEELRRRPEAALLAAEADDKVFNIVQLIYRSKSYEGALKDYEFSRRTMEEHWQAGLRRCGADAAAIPRCCSARPAQDGVLTFDLAEHSRE